MPADVVIYQLPLVTHVEGLTDEGADFVDRWLGNIVAVIDAGHITIPSAARDELTRDVKGAGLTWEFA